MNSDTNWGTILFLWVGKSLVVMRMYPSREEAFGAGDQWAAASDRHYWTSVDGVKLNRRKGR